ncbi:MAG: UDP-N-acetylmuramoyl-L-alanyl-D-glutamate--2,6-diaminopimelate ligase [Firmicutes bacterium]|nr:UDP-N-acetylmuramoyl-L-alanyl-D-glutamate--2,6-diaminopimelate ligase [Bacillota bacterium]
MRITDLCSGFKHQLIGENVSVNGIAYDSRSVSPGNVFVAIRGYKHDGHHFIPQAIANGAIAVISDHLVMDLNVPQVICEDTRLALALISAKFYHFPANKMRIIGITGTNGKTTTTYLIKAILERAGFKVGLVGTIRNLIGSEVVPAKRTTPESLELQQLLAEMYNNGVQYVVMEVSSHALELKRTEGIEFDNVIFTNLTQDHLDFHQSIEEYFNAKAKLFATLKHNGYKKNKFCVINIDDRYGQKLTALSTAPVASYGINTNSDFQARNIDITPQGVSYYLTTPSENSFINLQLTGMFNVYNSLAAIAACSMEGIDLITIQAALEKITGVDGRFELVHGGQDFTVIVDYAHTPDSLENILKTSRTVSNGRLIAVCGAGGDRDRLKRPLMGEVLASFADYTIITSDNPRSEDPAAICRDIEQGFLRKVGTQDVYEIIVDRRMAIKHAIQLAKKGDIVLIAGKGHETYQEFSKGIVHFDDREEALKAIKELL